MKHRLSLLLVFLGINTAMSQDIFKQHGFTKEPLTLSQGKYKEFFENQTLVQIGSVILNTTTYEVVAFVEEDTAALVYQADLSSRWLCPDPLAEEYYNISPYVYCVNNPIIFVDPDGLSHYSIDADGNIKMIKETKDKFDQLYVVDAKGNINKDIEALQVNDQTILSNLSLDRANKDEVGNYAVTSSSEVGNVFIFASNNSNVEWGLQGVQDGNDTKYIIATTHDKGKPDYADGSVNIDGAREDAGYQEKDLLFTIHTHQALKDGTKGASGDFSKEGGFYMGDMANISERYYRFKNDYKKPLPNHYVYHKASKGLYRYTPLNSSIFVKTVDPTKNFLKKK